jgi:pimeloyl-ACP methyl ester carboxylesterase
MNAAHRWWLAAGLAALCASGCSDGGGGGSADQKDAPDGSGDAADTSAGDTQVELDADGSGDIADSSADDPAVNDGDDGSGDAPDTSLPPYVPPDVPLYEGPDAAFPPADCDRSHRPLVLAHGSLASGDTWAGVQARFASNGECPDRVIAFDWNTVNRGLDHVAELDAFIDAVRAETGSEQVDLVGHSAGGGLGYDYLEDPTRAAKVAHYIHIGSFKNDAPAGPAEAPVPTLNLWSPDDAVIPEKGDIPGADNVSIAGLDHYQIATSPESFAAMYRFVRDGAEPATTDVAPEGDLWISGRVVSLGENIPTAGANLYVYAVDAATGARLDETPEARFIIGDDGRWGPFVAAEGARYEFEVLPYDTRQVPVRYFRTPFRRSSNLVYLRTFPGPRSLAATFLNAVRFDDRHSVVVVFSSDSAVTAGPDVLEVNGEPLATPDNASAEDTSIAFFAFDANLNGQSDRTTVALFESFPFLGALDLFLQPAAEPPIEVRLNESTIAMPGAPSRNRGALIAVFERY